MAWVALKVQHIPGVVTLCEAGGNDVRQRISVKRASDGFPRRHDVEATQMNLE